MRTRGWQGDLPQSEEEAQSRILEAARVCVERLGVDKASLSDIASELGVTRQTVYRYFANKGEVLAAIAESGTAEFLDRMEAALAHSASPTDALVGSVIYCLDAIPQDPYVGLLLQAGEVEMFSRSVTTSVALTYGVSMLHRLPVDWDAVGYSDDESLKGLAEIVMRLLQSFLKYPSDPPRTQEELRAFLWHWFALALLEDRVATR